MRHPLHNPSLAPVGFCGSISQQRINAKPYPEWSFNRERAIAKFWAGWNRQDAPHPLPVEAIIHEVLPAMATRFRAPKGEFTFEGKEYRGRDIAVLSSVVRWFGSGVGDCFLFGRHFFESKSSDREFLERFARENCRHAVLRECTHHVCTDACRRTPESHEGVLVFYRSFDPHKYEPVTKRDEVLVDGLMWWLGRRHGRSFLSAWKEKRDRLAHAAHQRFISSHPNLARLQSELDQKRSMSA